MKLAYHGKYLQHPGYLSKDQDPYLWQKNVLAEVETRPLMIQAVVRTVVQIALPILAVRRTTVVPTMVAATPVTMAAARTIMAVVLVAAEVADGEGALVAVAAETIPVAAAPTIADGGGVVAAEIIPVATETITITDHVDKIVNPSNSTTRNWSKVPAC